MPITTPLFKDEALEAGAREAIRLEEPRALIDRFATLVRESGTADEEAAAHYIVDRLKVLGIPFTLHAPDLYISLPERAELTILTSEGRRDVRARPPSFARSTGGDAVEGEVCYIPSRYAAGTSTLFDTPDAAHGQGSGADPVAGRIVLTEGYSMPGPVQAFERRGALAQIYIHPGTNIHEGICTSIWGAPTLDSIGRKPKTPVVCINQTDGQALIAEVRRGPTRCAVRTWLREGWMRCLLPVVEIRGDTDPSEFLLVHGHYDSWYEGIGDNATGDAALLELARVLWALRSRLRRSVRIAWWPGHSTGRYAGSTWYADTFADEIDEWCIAQLNIDSPGCAGATAYEEVMWMAEADRLCRSAIRDAVGVEPERVRPLRAGDYSFNQIGPTGLYMLLSNIPIEERKRRGYYAVGGCGGNIAWHTPDDGMPVADLEILRRDLAVYLTTIVRLLNAPLHPFDYGAAADEMRQVLEGYQTRAGGEIDLRPVIEDLRSLAAQIRTWQAEAEARVREHPEDAGQRRRLNAGLRQIARRLVPMNYARGERFDHDPAVKFGAVPRLEAAATLGAIDADLKPFVRVGLIREMNKLRAALRAVRRELRVRADARVLL
ncbi:MAG TPA: M28 family peptidase [Vicinamibacterales bacterium]|nr:M28 family peptidase [Vicinamibacterales bacterium]